MKVSAMWRAGPILALSMALGLTLAPLDAIAQSAKATATIGMLDDGLIGLMHRGAGMAAREAAIAPVIDRAFNLPLMTRLSVGPAWVLMRPGEQVRLVAAFRAMTIAQYAKNFSGWSGQRFVIDPKVDARGSDRLVRTILDSPHDSPEHLDYRMREETPGSGRWKIIDIYYRNAISQLATRRADFAGVLAHGGAQALIEHLNRLAANAQ